MQLLRLHLYGTYLIYLTDCHSVLAGQCSDSVNRQWLLSSLSISQPLDYVCTDSSTRTLFRYRVMYMYSRASDNGPSEKRTTSL